MNRYWMHRFLNTVAEIYILPGVVLEQTFNVFFTQTCSLRYI